MPHPRRERAQVGAIRRRPDHQPQGPGESGVGHLGVTGARAHEQMGPVCCDEIQRQAGLAEARRAFYEQAVTLGPALFQPRHFRLAASKRKRCGQGLSQGGCCSGRNGCARGVVYRLTRFEWRL